jgi:selenocysteine-specific elongation factor
MPRAALRGTLPDNVSVEVAELALERLRERGALAREGELVRLPSHQATLSESDRGVVKRLLHEARAAGLEPPGAREWADRLGISMERFRDLAAHLERQNELVRAPGELWYHAGAVSALRERVVGHLRTHGSLETPAYKALIGTTRRTAVPLMELFDEERLTIRRGTARLLRDRSSGSG